MVSLELKKKVGQMLMCGFPSAYVDDQARTLLEKYYVGNYIYFARNITGAEQLAALSKELSDMVYDALGAAPFLTLDQEGGIVSRLVEGAALYPGAAAVSAATRLTDEDLTRVRRLGRNAGDILRKCGINMDLAPDMDTNIEPANPVIGTRSYGDDPERVGAVASAMMLGMKDALVAGAIKHFPGHGNVVSDSHLGIPVNDTEESVLNETEFKAFELGIRAGADAVMSAHVRYTKVDPDNPGTLSHKIQTELLRGKMGFKGLSMTDCLEMDAIAVTYPRGEGAVRAIEAGVDILTISHTMKAISEAAEAIYAALESGRLSEARIDESYRRIMETKARMHLLERQEIDPKKAMEAAFNPEYLQLADEISADAHTLLCGSFDTDLSSPNVLVAAPPSRAVTGVEDMDPLSLTALLSKKGICGIEIPLQGDAAVESYTETIDRMIAEGKDHVILALYNARFRKSQEAILRHLEAKPVHLDVILMGAPYDLSLIHRADSVICAYEYTLLSVKTLIKALENKQFPGKTPFGKI